MIRALIIDDELNARKGIKAMVEKYCTRVEVIGTAANVEEAKELIQQSKPNLLLLDIEMPYGSGFKLLEQFPEPNFEVVFVTGFDQYALQAIKSRALDYLLKPVDIDELIEAVEKVRTRLREKTGEGLLRQISIQTNHGKEFIKVEDIVFCEADGPCTWIQLENKRLYSSKNLGEFEKLLPPPERDLQNKFFRIHHGFLVNFSYVSRFDRRDNLIQLSTEDKLPLAQRRKTDFLNWIEKK